MSTRKSKGRRSENGSIWKFFQSRSIVNDNVDDDDPEDEAIISEEKRQSNEDINRDPATKDYYLKNLLQVIDSVVHEHGLRLFSVEDLTQINLLTALSRKLNSIYPSCL